MQERLGTIGTIEGFYGPPWSHHQRLAHLRFLAAAGFDTFVYAPKDDPFHRRRWREPYPDAELARIAELAATAAGSGLRFVHALHPALDMRYDEDGEHERLAAKARQLYDAGIRAFALLFDDVPRTPGLGAAHGTTVRRFRDGFLRPHGIDGPVLVCPTDYAGTDPSEYRSSFAGTAPEDVLITWTGRDVVVGSVTRPEIDAAAASYGRPLVLWDNFPVNDYEPSRLFLGPLTGRTGDVAGSALVGVIGNAMLEEPASRLALATVATWARDPGAYSPDAAHAAALTALGAQALEPFVRACRTWPPSADQDPALSAAIAAALAGESTALGEVEARLSELLACATAPEGPSELLESLRPWLAGAAATARAGLAAVALLRGNGSVADARRALAEAESHYANVLRPIVPPFVRGVLERTDPRPPAGVPVAVLGAADDPGVVAAVELLATLGCAPTVGTPAADAALVVVTASATEVEALVDAPLPVLAWGRFVELGLATRADIAMLRDGLAITAPEDPLAAGLAGVVPLYRGPGYVRVADLPPTATVVARGPDQEGRPVIFRYDPGAALATGAPAPALRIGTFPVRPGPARWLLDDTGRALLAAAVRMALGRPPAERV